MTWPMTRGTDVTHVTDVVIYGTCCQYCVTGDLAPSQGIVDTCVQTVDLSWRFMPDGTTSWGVPFVEHRLNWPYRGAVAARGGPPRQFQVRVLPVTGAGREHE